MEFVHLHTHTQHSLLDGCCNIKDLFKEASAQGFKALAITDHGSLSGVIEFYKEGLATGIKPIIGCEMYVAPQTLDIKKPIEGEPGGGYHLVLLAKNNEGYHNLLKLATIASLDGFYYKPRIDKATLAKYSSGLIASTACLKGSVPYWAIRNEMDRATKEAKILADIMGKENFFLEIQNHGIPEEELARKAIEKIAKKNKFQLVATNDIHYLKKEHAVSHDVLVCIQTGKLVSDTDRMKYTTDQLYMRSTDEMIELFGKTPSAIDNTVKIAEMCNVNIELGKTLLPKFPIPLKGMNAEQYLRHLAQEGAKKRFEEINKRISERLDYELSVIDKTGFAGYFLIVQDFIRHAKENGIPVGPGRGSVAGSLVAFCIGITDVNPLEYGLLFERFLNPERISMPDIDVDFADSDRQKVIDYVISKYGKENVGQISTFGTLGARSAIRDIGRALGAPLSFIDSIAKAIPLNADLEDAEGIAELKQYIDTPLWKHAKVLEGLHRHASTHAAGLVIAPKKIIEYSALGRGSSGEAVTQLDMHSVEALGLLKMDFLGLKTLTVINETIKHLGGWLNINEIHLDDEKTMQLFRDGHTIGVFQFESQGMSGYLKQLQPEGIEDLAAMNALYRPGPIKGGVIPSFIRRKHDEEEVAYIHEKMEQSLKPTYGIIVFQEQAMKIAQDLAGFTLGEADILRKAMGKKDKDLMEAQKEKFVSGCVTNGVDEEIGIEVFDLIDKFSGYGFNKCLSGDTLVRRCGANQYNTNPNIRLDTLYEKFYSRTSVGKKYRGRGVYIYGGDEDTAKKVRVINIFQNGIKPIIRVTTYSGKQIKVTPNHRLMTIGGWKVAHQLTVGDRLQTTDFICTKTNNTYSFTGKKQTSKGWYSASTPGFPAGRENPMYIDGSYSDYKKWQDDNYSIVNCQECRVRHNRLETHHKDNNRSNNTNENLIKLCPSCHKKEHYKKHDRTKRGERGYETYFEKIINIECLDSEMTYDIEVDDKSHAFYANGILSHNSHAVGYAIIAYQTAWLKANYPVEFMSALLTSEMGDQERMFELFTECKRMGIPILPPDINESNSVFTPTGDSIRFGINAIRNIGDDFAKEIQKNRPYTSIYDFTTRIKSSMYNTKKLESIIGAGAFSSFGTYLGHQKAIDDANSFGRTIQANKFKMMIDPDIPNIDNSEEISRREIMSMEKVATGFYITGHPTDECIRSKSVVSPMEAKEFPPEVNATVMGVLSNLTVKTTKAKKKMCVAILEDSTSCIEVVFFPTDYEKMKDSIKEDVVVVITGNINENNSGNKVLAAKFLSIPKNK